jgi:archaemetzincin
MGFQPPGPQKRLEAIGATNGLPAALQGAFTPDDDFQPVPVLSLQDWLAVHREPGQMFDDFRHSQRNRPDARRRIIYLQPLGDFRAQQSSSMQMLRQYAADFFQNRVDDAEAWLTVRRARMHPDAIVRPPLRRPRPAGTRGERWAG